MPVNCLIVERHDWETGGNEQQLQLPLDPAYTFFGAGTTTKRVVFRVFDPKNSNVPTSIYNPSISKVYANQTRRINGFGLMSNLPTCYIFIQETDTPNEYDVWWRTDKSVVESLHSGWNQAPDSQYGPGRRYIIVTGPVPR